MEDTSGAATGSINLVDEYLQGLDRHKEKGTDFLRTAESRILLAGIARERMAEVMPVSDAKSRESYSEWRGKMHNHIAYAYVRCGGDIRCMIPYLRKVGIKFDEALEIINATKPDHDLIFRCFAGA